MVVSLSISVKKLQHWMNYINAIGHSYPLQVNPHQPMQPAVYSVVRELTQRQIQDLVTYNRGLICDVTNSKAVRERAQLEFVALAREAMYRTTGKFPYSTQIIAMLNVMLQGGNILSGINTGQGKGLTSALFCSSLMD